MRNHIRKFNESLHTKEDVKIVLYKFDDADCVNLIIVNRNSPQEFRRLDHRYFSFLRELDDLNIIFEGDEWVCKRTISRSDLKRELERRNFYVIMGEDY
jgi:hypothetical protein